MFKFLQRWKSKPQPPTQDPSYYAPPPPQPQPVAPEPVAPEPAAPEIQHSEPAPIIQYPTRAQREDPELRLRHLNRLPYHLDIENYWDYIKETYIPLKDPEGEFNFRKAVAEDAEKRYGKLGSQCFMEDNWDACNFRQMCAPMDRYYVHMVLGIIWDTKRHRFVFPRLSGKRITTAIMMPECFVAMLNEKEKKAPYWGISCAEAQCMTIEFQVPSKLYQAAHIRPGHPLDDRIGNVYHLRADDHAIYDMPEVKILMCGEAVQERFMEIGKMLQAHQARFAEF